MAIETRARDIIIADARNRLELRRHINANQKDIARPVNALWKRQGKLVTIATVKLAIKRGSVPPEWEDPWNEMITEFVEKDMVEQWLENMEVAGDRIAGKVNRIQRKQFDFNPTSWSVKDWIDTNGGRLIKNLTEAQFDSMYALLQHQIALGVTSPYILAQRIMPIIGLTKREALALTRVMTSLIEEGIPPAQITKRIEKYASFLHKNRAARIARTEISNAYNFGQLDSLKQARDAGWLPGDPKKDWIAGGANPCEICQENEGVGSIELDAAFPSGDAHPTAHPQCECSLGYKVRR